MTKPPNLKQTNKRIREKLGRQPSKIKSLFLQWKRVLMGPTLGMVMEERLTPVGLTTGCTRGPSLGQAIALQLSSRVTPKTETGRAFSGGKLLTRSLL